MTTSLKIRSPSTTPLVASPRYEDDVYGWVEHQVALLKAGRLSEIDADNIAEELSDVGRDQYNRLESALRVLMLHLLKWDHQATHRSRSWVRSIEVQRKQIARLLRENPSLKPRIPEATREAYDDARGGAAFETSLAEANFPTDCPYDWSVITTRFVEFDDQRSPKD